MFARYVLDVVAHSSADSLQLIFQLCFAGVGLRGVSRIAMGPLSRIRSNRARSDSYAHVSSSLFPNVFLSLSSFCFIQQ